MDEIIKLIEEMVIAGDAGEEIILKNGSSAKYLYGDRTHMYERRWLDWRKNRHRHAWRMGCSRWWTGMLLTVSDSPVCCEEQVEQTLSVLTTVKDLIWLLFDVPPDLEFQHGRTNAACGHIQRMILLGHSIIDDDDESWVTARTGNSGGMVQDGGGQIKCMRELTLNLRNFEALHKFYLVQCRLGRIAAGDPRNF